MSDDLKIGGMHGELGLDVRGWFDGFEDAREVLADFAKEVMSQFKELEGNIRNAAIGMSAAITVPFAGMTVATKRGAGAFEKSMNNVHAALRGISGDQLEALSQAARKLGPEVGRGAKEAADGIETLALAGMSARDILGGGLEQTLRLAAANAAELGSSAALVTDVMAQFNKSTSDLEAVVNQVTGSLDASKLGFNDFKDAIAQGGGVAGAAGVSFEDFNTALAGTAALFGSGSDAGTSFKTFITTLTPKSKEAAAMMEKLGLDFYDATGKMKGLADISDMLREKLGNLSDRSRTNVLNEIFGADAMRTAIGLMRLGGDAFDDLQRSIGETDAGEKLAIQLQGVEESSNRLSDAFDELKIAMGETGILAVFTSVQDALTSITRWFAELPLAVRQVIVAIWGLTAAVGPMILALMGIGKILAPIILLRGGFGLFGAVLAGLINPIGTMVALLGRLAIALSGVSVALRTVGLAMTAWAGWIGLVVTALTLLVLWSARTVTANSAAQQAADRASAAYDKQQAATLQLVSATGAARKALIEKMKAARADEIQAMANAKADVTAARAALARAKMQPAGQSGSSTARFGYLPGNERNTEVEKAEANLLSLSKTLETHAKTVEGYTRDINTPEFGTVDLNFEDDAKKSKTPKASGPSAQDLANRREQMQLEQQMAVARARDDKDEMRRLQDKMDVFQRQKDYEDAGLGASAAKLAAEKDIAEIKAAEAEYDAREVARAENVLDQQLAEIRGDEQMARLASDKAYLEERTAFWQDKGLNLLEAQKRAAEDLVQVDIARADAAAKLARSQALDRDAELSRLRSDSADRQRAANRAAQLSQRSEQYYRDGEGKVSESAARERASRELDEEEIARQQGQWRDTFKGAMRAAMDGDLKDFASNWWKDQVSKGMEQALNDLSDMLFNLFRQALGQGSASASQSGGLLGGIFGTIKSAFGGASSSASASGLVVNSNAISNAFAGLPGFATGGSFEIGGKPGIDTNLVQFWGTAGETVNVRRGGASGDGGSTHIYMQGVMTTDDFWSQIGALTDGAALRGAAGGSAMAQTGVSKSARRRIPGR
ncbi:phage tail tape measure protein [Sphingobium yanoikuyae]|uniref:phage tail tape measure protein n=1 Tax=Sphingobium yanoikuyae TaxID=13690 RepID=UPI00259B84FA|nr:phage tail tape measure protein [uncultured Sphingobium sp.]